LNALDHLTWVKHQLKAKSLRVLNEQQIIFKRFENLLNPLCSKVIPVSILPRLSLWVYNPISMHRWHFYSKLDQWGGGNQLPVSATTWQHYSQNVWQLLFSEKSQNVSKTQQQLKLQKT
jgi:hypothetical protein